MIRVRPTISIITPSLNSGQTIGRAIESVLAQNYVGVQHIIRDGGSNDQTREVMDRFTHLSVSILSDLSSHHAANDGLAEATGELVGYLNADDWYEPGAFDAVADIFQADPTINMICGSAAFHSGNLPSYHRRHRQGQFRLTELTLGVPAFNSYFFRRDFLLQLGGFRTQFDYAADRDLLLRAYAIADCHVSDRQIYNYQIHPKSRTMNGDLKVKNLLHLEHRAIAADLLADHAIPANMGLALARWHAFETFQLIPDECKQGRLFKALSRLIWSLARVHRLAPAVATKLRMHAKDQRSYIIFQENATR